MRNLEFQLGDVVDWDPAGLAWAYHPRNLYGDGPFQVFGIIDQNIASIVGLDRRVNLRWLNLLWLNPLGPIMDGAIVRVCQVIPAKLEPRWLRHLPDTSLRA